LAEIVISPERTSVHEETDRIVRVARIVAQAETTFGNHAKALRWLRTADDRMGERRPLSMLQTDVYS
jgi:putative toxin-antitoxin system antitoxin component (TIGR02293 family)